MFDDIRNKFPFYRENKGLVYLDYAATTFMPDNVMDAWYQYNCSIGTSINRGNGILADKAISIYEDSKKNIIDFFDADDYEMILGKNATECLNLVATAFGGYLNSGDIILMSPYEHHSNLLPWKKIADQKGAIVVQLPLCNNGEIDYSFVNSLELESIRIIAMTLMSNINAYALDIEKLKNIMNITNAYTILDASQAVGHKKISFNDISADVYVAPAHKMYGPKSIASAFIRKALVEELPPFLLGGGMVWNSMGGKVEWQSGVRKYEAGTLDISNVVAWSSACTFLKNIGMDYVEKNDAKLANHITTIISKEESIKVIPYNRHNLSMLSFSVKNIHSHDVAEIMKHHRIEMRVGHMCAQNTVSMFGMESICRISWGLGNNTDDLDTFYKTLRECIYG